MVHTFVVYVHLIATCAAIGTIVVTDLRLLAKVLGYRVVIPPPERFETVMISAALVVLYLSGAGLVWMGLEHNGEYLSNEKLQGKMVLVAFLTANAMILHRKIFPILSRYKTVSGWSWREWLLVATSVSLSNSIWFFCAFLGIARVWNHNVSLVFVIAVALTAWTLMFAGVNAVLLLASRDAPKVQPDWVDFVKSTFSDFAPVDERSPLN